MLWDFSPTTTSFLTLSGSERVKRSCTLGTYFFLIFFFNMPLLIFLLKSFSSIHSISNGPLGVSFHCFIFKKEPLTNNTHYRKWKHFS